MSDSDRTESKVKGPSQLSFELEFPPLPRTVAEVTKLVAEQADPPDTPRLVEIVKADPVVGSSVLRRINSAYYGLRTRVVQIEKACQFLGFEEVCDIVTASGVMKMGDVFESDEQIEIFDRLMELSLGAAAFSKRLAEQFELKEQALAFTCGLLHTVGRLILLYNRPKDYQSLWFTSSAGRPPAVTSEQIIFGTDHAELSAYAGDEWNLDDSVVMVMRHYLTPGHVKHPDLRVLALSLATASAAAEHYCLSGFEAESTFSPPATLYGLARAVEQKPAALKKYIEQESGAVRQFVRSMTDPQTD